MSTIESIFLFAVYVSALMLFCVVSVAAWAVLEKIGFLHWLRGWLWYFGIIDECPDTKRDR